MKFDCGCVIEGKLDLNNIRLDCPKTWDSITQGLNKGVFQLESQLGRKWSRKLKPNSIEELSDLIALIRPGTLKSGMTDKYIAIKDGLEEESYINDALIPSLKDTKSVLIYQEQVMSIVTNIAGFTLEESDKLRKAVGKKLPELMKSIEEKFIAGALKNGHTEEVAKEIWSWIVEFSGYGFNKCLSPKTTVYNDKGLNIQMQYVKTGDKILAYDPTDNMYYYDTVLDVIDQGEQECYDFYFEGRPSWITCTMNHKFMCSDKIMRPMVEIIANNYYLINGQNKTKVTKYVPAGKIKTIDFTMASDNHNFVAEGLVTSNSHSVSYALIGYQCAYSKTHFPLQFYTSMLRYSINDQDSQQEIREIINECKLLGIEVLPPSVQEGNEDFNINQKGQIVFGLSHVKGVSSKTAKQVRKFSNLTNFDEVLHKLPETKINKTVMEGLIKCGAFDYLGEDRKTIFQKYQTYLDLSPKELEYYLKNNIGILNIIANILDNNICSKTRRNTLEDLRDQRIETSSKTERISYEKYYIGLSLSGEEDDLYKNPKITHKCIDASIEVPRVRMAIGCTVDSVKKITTKKGTEMAFMSGSDESFMLDNIVIFPEAYEEYKDKLDEGRSLILIGSKDKDGAFIVEKVDDI